LRGNGEEFFLSLIENDLKPGIYYAEDFNTIKKYKINENFLSNFNEIHLIFRGSECSWNKCKFCPYEVRYKKETRDKYTVNDTFESFLYYYNRGKRYFRIMDHETPVELAIKLLEKIVESGCTDIYLGVFGMRFEKFDKLKYLIYFTSFLKRGINLNLGLEFIEQKFADLYNKGIEINILEIFNVFEYANNLKVRLNIFLMIGMPYMDKKYYKKLFTFLNIGKSMFDYIVFFPSFLKLCWDMEMFNDLNYYNIILKEREKIYDIEEIKYNLPIHLNTYDFLLYDYDKESYLTRQEAFKLIENDYLEGIVQCS
jgi:hypothetical protein